VWQVAADMKEIHNLDKTSSFWRLAQAVWMCGISLGQDLKKYVLRGFGRAVAVLL